MKQNGYYSEVYSLKNREISVGFGAMKTPFMLKLKDLAREQARQGKFATFIPNNILAKRGDLANTSMVTEQTVLDINNLVPLESHIARNVQEEMSLYMQEELRPRFRMVLNDNSYIAQKDLLSAMYLLTAFICYVEVYQGGDGVDKFVATRSIKLLDSVIEMDNDKLVTAKSMVATKEGDLYTKKIGVAVITQLKNGKGLSRGRKILNIAENDIRITPLFLIEEFYEGLKELLTTKLLKIKYIKDNLTEREIITTLNTNYLLNFYNQTQLYKLLQNIGTNAHRGYVTLPMIGLSKFDETGVRAVNIGRITSIEEVSLSSPEVQNKKRYLEVDLSKTIMYFSMCIQSIFDIDVLRVLYNHASGNNPSEAIYNNLVLLKTDTVTAVESKFEEYGTTYLEWLHDYMMNQPVLFKRYIDNVKRERELNLGD